LGTFAEHLLIQLTTLLIEGEFLTVVILFGEMVTLKTLLHRFQNTAGADRL
jgi:hypothetical protein